MTTPNYHTPTDLPENELIQLYLITCQAFAKPVDALSREEMLVLSEVTLPVYECYKHTFVLEKNAYKKPSWADWVEFDIQMY